MPDNANKNYAAAQQRSQTQNQLRRNQPTAEVCGGTLRPRDFRLE